MTTREILDIDGYPIQIESVRTDSQGQHFDISQARKRDGKWYYRGKLLPLNNFHIGLTQFRGYRETLVDDNEEGELIISEMPMDEDLHALTQDPNSILRTPTSSTPRHDPSNRPMGRDIPKLKDMGLDNIQLKTVVQHPNQILRDLYCPSERHYLELVTKYTQLAKLPPAARKRKFLGFDPQELLLNGALHCNPCRPSNLKYGPTLTIFREENFLDTPQPQLEVLKPALALAERILLKGNPRFWVDLACGERIPDYTRIEREGARVERLSPVSKVTQELKDKTFTCLQALGRRLVIRFEALKNVYGCCAHPIVTPVQRPLSGYMSRGQFWPVNEMFKLPTSFPTDPWEQQAVIKIDSKLFAAAKKFSMQKYPDVAAQLRFTFFFAVNLLHELAHAFEAKCGHGNYYELISKDRSKPGALSRSYFCRIVEAAYKNHEIEMGAAWEHETFGGRVHPINHDFSLSYGLQVYHGGPKGHLSAAALKAIRSGEPVGKAVPMGFIEELHQESYWENVPAETGVLIPTCGPKTFIMHSTSTVDWRRHLLENDASHGVAVLERVFDEQTHISKRMRGERPFPKPNTRVSDGKPRRQLFQTKLRKYPKKADAAAVQIKTDLITHAILEEKVKRNAREHAPTTTAAVPHEYYPPAPDQPAIDEKFSYINSEDQYNHQPLDPRLDPNSDFYDPLLKLPHQLTINDKWLLLEDYAILAHGWDSLAFLAKRAAMPRAIFPLTGLEPIPKQMIPSNDLENWGEIQCGMLRVLREKNPGRGLTIERARKHVQREAKKAIWRVKAEMEELVVRKGGNRVSWMRGRLDLKLLGLDGMEVGNFDERFRGELERLRDEERAMLRKGKVTVDESGQLEEPGEEQVKENKITDYFSRQEGKVEDDVLNIESKVEGVS